jgi:fumarate reductase subunit C
MIEFRLFLIQRITAGLLLLMGAVHLAILLAAAQAPLSAAAILARTHASPFWPGFYAVFAITAATHAALGLRVIAREWLGWRGTAWGIGLWVVLVAVGLRAAWIIA